MHATTLTLLAMIGAVAHAQSPGTAHVVNMCSYDVYLCNVPAAGGGYEQSEQTLSSGQSWSQVWTQLTNNDGWSIKLSMTDSLENILQYEYTWQGDGTIWYDLSCVNGNPWDGNWEITSSTANCSPKQQAYRYATDDAYGMQSCPADASITVTLCSGEATNNGTYASASSAAASAYTSESSAAPSSYSAPAVAPPVYSAPVVAPAASSPIVPAPAASVTHAYNWNNVDASKSLAPESTPAVTPTTFATSYDAAAVGPSGNVIKVVETVWVTDIVTAYSKPRARRHEHHHNHHHA